jgi:CubicO group peptidase (beta-lactamase class C family)
MMILTLLSVALCQRQAFLLDPNGDLVKILDAYEPKHFNGFIYVEQDGRQLFFHSVGYANRERRQPFTFDTGIEIGSIVKPISKIAILRLCAAAKLSLDDPISKFFPNVPADKKSITIRLLAEHRAGFQDVFGDDYDPMKRDELMQKMLDSKLVFEPGTKDQYSNSGYSMLATIIEKVSGKSFEQCVADMEFSKIGLKRTG